MTMGTSTFTAWIRRELVRLSGSRTADMRRLAALAQGDRLRIVEPLLLYAVATDRVGRLMGLVWREPVARSYRAAGSLLSGVDLEQAALSGTVPDGLPWEYGKFLMLYRSYRLLPEAERQFKASRREKALRMQAMLGTSTTVMSRALGVDAGNLGVWLRHGDPGRISDENSVRVVRYLRLALCEGQEPART